MPRRFNVAGPRKPDIHYMLPAAARVPLARPVMLPVTQVTVTLSGMPWLITMPRTTPMPALPSMVIRVGKRTQR